MGVGVGGVKVRDCVVQVDVLEVFVEVDAIGCVSWCGCSEVKHKIWYCTGAWVEDAESTCVKIHLADE